jgi:glycosyltransferase involved in cell wall biosynthesis
VVASDDGGSIFSTLEQGAPEYASTFERVYATPTGADIGALCAAYGVDPDMVVVAPHGVDPSWAEAAPPTAADRDRLGVPPRHLLFVGSVEPRKGLATLVRAHAEARRAEPDVPPLVVVGATGWGDAWGGVEPAAADVLRTGYLADHDLRMLVRGAVALALPSRDEGFGLPVLEALACGTPALVSDLPAHREVGGDVAVRLPVGDTDAWAAAICAVSTTDDPPRARTTRRDHAATFTWQRSAQRHLDAWRDAATGGRTAHTMSP